MDTIQDQIDRIQNNVNDSFDAVEEYGVARQSGDTSDQLAARIKEIGGKYLSLDGGTMNGVIDTSFYINLNGSDLNLKTTNSTSDDSGDIVWYYGNGQEKARLWTDNIYSTAKGLNYRCYSKNGNELYSGVLTTGGPYLPLTAGDSNTITGNVYIKKTSSDPSALINISGPASTLRLMAHNNGDTYIYSGDQNLSNPTTLHVVGNPGTKLTKFDVQALTSEFSGPVNSTGGFFQTSDIRKKNIHEEISLEKAYDLIDKCQTILYDLKDDEEHKLQLGLIAQEVEEFFPEIVITGDDDSKSLDYSRLTVIILRVLKDVINRLSKLEDK